MFSFDGLSFHLAGDCTGLLHDLHHIKYFSGTWTTLLGAGHAAKQGQDRVAAI